MNWPKIPQCRTSPPQNSDNHSSTFFANQQVAWSYHFHKPAQILSVYANHSYSQSSINQLYRNQWGGLNEPQLSNHNYIVRQNATQILNTQIIYAQPIAERWLAELKANFEIESAPVQQRAYQFSPLNNDFSITRPDLGIDCFKNLNYQQTYNFSTLYKSNDFILKLGTGIWHWKGKRTVENNRNLYDQVRLFSQLFAQYRLGKSSKITFKYNERPQQISDNNIFPVVDSSDIQQIRIGNSMLQPYSTSQSELSAVTTTSNGHFLSMKLKYDRNANPVINSSFLTLQGLSTLTFAQQGNQTQQANMILSWVQYSPNKSYNAYALVFFGWQQNNILFNNQFKVFQNYYSFVTGSLNWKPNKRIAVKADLQANYFSQSQQQSAGNYRGEVSIKASYKWSEETFLEIQNTTFLSKSMEAKTVNNQILNIELYKYFLRSKRLKSTISINIF